jgi:hypothetical protein
VKKQMSGSRPGGGINSKVINPQGQRLGTPARGVSPGAVSQLGEAVGNHISDGSGGRATGYRGDKWFDGKTPISVPLGNQIAGNVGKAGPGSGRQVAKSGSQGMHGSPAAGNPPPRGELFPGWPAKGRP